MTATADDAVSTLWATAWLQLRVVFPDIESRLAQLEHTRPTKARALARLEASAGRAAGRCLRGTAKPIELLKRLWAWQAAVLAEVEK